MSTYLWDPFAVLDRLDREFDPVVRTSFGAPRPRRAALAPVARAVAAAERFGGVVPPADVVTDGDDVVIKVELPGVDVEKDVTVEIDRGRLVVRGQRDHSTESTEGGRIRRERWHGEFRREFALPEHVAADKVAATYDRGVLSVRLPRAATVPASTRVPVTAGPAAAELPVTTPEATADATAEATNVSAEPSA
jgi:HSP20 family protein